MIWGAKLNAMKRRITWMNETQNISVIKITAKGCRKCFYLTAGVMHRLKYVKRVEQEPSKSHSEFGVRKSCDFFGNCFSIEISQRLRKAKLSAEALIFCTNL